MLGDVRAGWKAEAEIECIASSEINGRCIWMYELYSPIGYIYVVQYELRQDPALITKTVYDDGAKAERYYKATCRKMVKE